MRRRRGAALALALGLVALISTSSAERSEGGSAIVWGISSNYLWTDTTDLATSDLPQLAGSNVTSAREDVLWEVVEPQQDQFDWTRYDTLIEVNASNGLSVLPLFSGSALWANSLGRRDKPPDDIADYVDLVRAYLIRYGPNGEFWTSHPDLVQRPADAVELWNEPWYARFWGPRGGDVLIYARMVHAVADMVHVDYPTVRVVANGDWKWDHAIGAYWIDALLTADPTIVDAVDAFAAHPYPWPFTSAADNCAESLSQLASIRRRLGATSRPDVPVWVTELGVRVQEADGSPTYEGSGATDYLRCVLGSKRLGTWLGSPARFYAFVFQRTAVTTDDPDDFGYDLLTEDGQPTDLLEAYLNRTRTHWPGNLNSCAPTDTSRGTPLTGVVATLERLQQPSTLREAVRCFSDDSDP